MNQIQPIEPRPEAQKFSEASFPSSFARWARIGVASAILPLLAGCVENPQHVKTTSERLDEVANTVLFLKAEKKGDLALALEESLVDDTRLNFPGSQVLTDRLLDLQLDYQARERSADAAK